MKKPEAVTETLWRYRGVLLVLLIPVILIAAVLTILPRTSTLARDPMLTINELQNHKSGLRYAIVFDAGSTGSRVHIFKFNLDNGDLKLESDTFEQLKPGLSSYADDPAKAAASLLPLIETALKTVPKELQAMTPVSLKATAGLRLLDGDKAEKILQAVTQTLAALPFKLADDAVGIMDGKDEGAYAWLTLNYLLGKLGRGASQTVSAIDLGGGSVQEAFALTSEQAQNAPKEFLTKLSGGGKTYNVYVHSYLGYGLMAARAKVIETAKDAADKGHPCYAKGSDSVYKYAGKDYPFKAVGEVASFKQCTAVHVEALDVKKECAAPQEECTFSGVWHGKRPSDAPYFLSSYFWDRAMDTGLIKDERAIMWTTSPSEFATTAVEVCGQKGIEAVSKTYPRAKPDGVPFLCTDLTYVVQLMLAGFKLPPTGQLTLVKQIEYNGQNIEAAWPLGAAVNDLSS